MATALKPPLPDRRPALGTAADAQQHVHRGPGLDVVRPERASVLHLLAGHDETLLAGRDAFCLVKLHLHDIKAVGGLDMQSHGLARHRPNADLHAHPGLEPVQLLDLLGRVEGLGRVGAIIIILMNY
eukprot:9205055-Heterocapsa_arctica.AAC.1